MYKSMKTLIGRKFYKTAEIAQNKLDIFYAANRLTDEEYLELSALVADRTQGYGAYTALRVKNASIAQCFADSSFREEPYWMEIYSLRIITARTGALVPGGAEMTCIFASDRNYRYPCFVIVPGSVDRLSRGNPFHIYAVPIAVSPYVNTLGEEKECLVLLAGDIYTGM